MRWQWNVTALGAEGNECKLLVIKPERKGQLDELNVKDYLDDLKEREWWDDPKEKACLDNLQEDALKEREW